MRREPTYVKFSLRIKPILFRDEFLTVNALAFVGCKQPRRVNANSVANCCYRSPRLLRRIWISVELLCPAVIAAEAR